MPNHLGCCDIEECESAERGEATQIQKQKTRIDASQRSISSIRYFRFYPLFAMRNKYLLVCAKIGGATSFRAAF